MFLLIAIAITGCSALPAFGPEADDISNKQDIAAFPSGEQMPFEVVSVTAQTLPTLTGSFKVFPVQYRAQSFRDSDEFLSTGDELDIVIWEVGDDGLFGGQNRRETRLTVLVSNSGYITVPYAGTLKAVGLTVLQLRKELLKLFKGKAIDPEIVVEIKATESRFVTVLGKVNSPGRISVPSRGIRLLDLLAKTGGTPADPWETSIFLYRGPETVEASLVSILDDGKNNIVIFPGDTLSVAHIPRRFAVYGGVFKPSNIEIPVKAPNLAFLLAEAGGLDDFKAQQQSVFVFRPGDQSRKAKAYRLDFSRPDAMLLASSFRLSPADITYVPSAGAADFQKFVSLFLGPLLGSTRSTIAFGNSVR